MMWNNLGKRRATTSDSADPSEESLSEDEITSTSSNSDSETSTTSSSSSSSGSDSEANLSFECFNMDKKDHHGISLYINGTFGRGVESFKGGESGVVDTLSLTGIIIDVLSEYVGTTAKSDDEEFPLAYISFIPFRFREYSEEQLKCMQSLGRILLDTARKGKVEKKAMKIIEEALSQPDDLALVLYERFINLPPEVGAPLYKQLVDDLPAAIEESRSFEPKHVLFIVPIYRELESQLPEEEEGGTSRKRNHRHKMMKEETELNVDYQYYYAEDELLLLEGGVCWDFKIKTPHETPDSRRAFGDRGADIARRAFLLSLEEFRQFATQTQTLL